MTATKNLLIRPVDIGLNPLGAGSVVADVQVEVAVDRDVALNDGTYIAGGVAFVATSIPTDGLKVPVVANDDPAITTGDGFSVVVTATYRPRRGSHRHPQRFERRILITSADPDVINLADAKPVRLVPFYMRPSEYVTHLETTLMQAQSDLESARSTVDAQAKAITDLRARNTPGTTYQELADTADYEHALRKGMAGTYADLKTPAQSYAAWATNPTGPLYGYGD